MHHGTCELQLLHGLFRRVSSWRQAGDERRTRRAAGACAFHFLSYYDARSPSKWRICRRQSGNRQSATGNSTCDPRAERSATDFARGLSSAHEGLMWRDDRPAQSGFPGLRLLSARRTLAGCEDTKEREAALVQGSMYSTHTALHQYSLLLDDSNPYSRDGER